MQITMLTKSVQAVGIATRDLPRVAIACLAIVAFGCASDKEAGAPATRAANHPTPPDHAKTATVHYPSAAAHTAAENSLAVSGFEVNKKQSDEGFIEADRPRHMGLFVGSGGEVCRVWLRSVAADETEVKVDSIKTFVGMMGQKEWDSTVLAEILRDLNK